jgi:LssY-like putative type I secretion system component LssY
MRRENTAAGVLAILVFSIPVFALDVPANTELDIRLKTKVSTQTAKSGDTVDAILIAPVMVGNDFAVPAGAPVHGTIDKATQPATANDRALLVLKFSSIEINGEKVPLAAKLTGIDNAREKLDDQGQISGILASETMTGEIDSGLNKLEGRFSGLASVLGTVKGAVIKQADTSITYDAGVEMELQLTEPLKLSKAGGAGPAANVRAIPQEAQLEALVHSEPFQTMAQNPAKPSDVTNLVLIGSPEAVQAAFTAAGWSNAAQLSTQAKFQTFQALAEDRGYNEAPVSILMLDGKPPDLVFEKLNNTFQARHHLRVWRRSATFLGQPVWSVAATHDTGISFSEKDRTFIHKIDSQIDRERAKVTNDLILTGHVQGVELVDRPNVPQHGQNATGDNLDTDGRVAVLLLN